MKVGYILVGAALAFGCPFSNLAAHAASAAEQQVTGMVQDALGRPLAEVTLSLKSASGQVLAQTKSDSEGKFKFEAVELGTYEVAAEKERFQPSSVIVTVSAGTTAVTTVTLASKEALDLRIATEKLESARNSLLPETGSSIYRFDSEDINNLPAGSNTPINDVLLQAPGVAQDSFGQFHVRGEHANNQFRINGVILPEGITGFGQTVDARFINRMDFLTGALPAQYGYRTSSVTDLFTKTGAFENGGDLGVYGGSHNTLLSYGEAFGSKGPANFYAIASYQENDLGITPPTPGPDPIHDHSDQGAGFGYFSYLLSDEARINLIAADVEGNFELPNNPGQPQVWNLNGVPFFDSAFLDESQRETNRYGVLALQGTSGASFNYQVAAFSRFSKTTFNPDPSGDLIFTGVASTVTRSSFVNGSQADASYKLNQQHTLRSGYYVSAERAVSNNSSSVFPTDTQFLTDSTMQTSDVPFSIIDNTSKWAWLYGFYFQDEWRPIDKLTVNYGARADRYDGYSQGGQISPRLGAIYQLTPQTAVHAAYARYFTPPPTELVAPSAISLFEFTSNAPFNGLNSPVKPERSHYFDVGITNQPIPNLNLGLDGYYKYARDLLDEGQFGSALIFTPFNYNRGRVYGTEFTANYKQGRFSSYTNFAYSQAWGNQVESGQFNFEDDELAYIANNYVHLDHDQLITASAGAAYLLAGTNFTLDGLYGSGLRSGFANTDHVKPSLQLNLGATRSFDTPLLGKLIGRFTLINILDRTNILRNGTGIGVFGPQYAPRRAVYAGLSKQF